MNISASFPTRIRSGCRACSVSFIVRPFCWKENMTKGRDGSSSIRTIISVSSTWNLKDYLDVAGIFIDRNTELGAIYIQGQTLLGERLPKLATIYLLLLKLIYDEQMAAASSSVNIVTTFGALSARAGEFRLTRSLSSVSEIRRALAILKKYQMIEPLDALEELNEGTRILIYPCINLLLMREDIKKLLAVFGEEAGQDVAVTEEISAADETAAEEEGETGNGEL